jgi:hypothetical protein
MSAMGSEAANMSGKNDDPLKKSLNIVQKVDSKTSQTSLENCIPSILRTVAPRSK